MNWKHKLKIKWNNFRTKWAVIRGIITGKYKHWFFVHLDDEDFYNLYTGNSYGTKTIHYHMLPWAYKRVINDMKTSEDELLLMKLSDEVKYLDKYKN